MNRTTDSRRRFLGTTAASAIGLSAAQIGGAVEAQSARIQEADSALGKLAVLSKRSIPTHSTGDLLLRFGSKVDLHVGAKLWLFFDIRQGAKVGQNQDASSADFLTITVDGQKVPHAAIQTPPVPRTFDLFPAAPEFMHMIELTLDRAVPAGTAIDFAIHRWTGPQQPIDPFRFWLVVDDRALWDFAPIGFRRYRKFVYRSAETRVPTEQLFERAISTAIQVAGEYPPVPAISQSPANTRDLLG